MDSGRFENIRTPQSFRERAADFIARVVGSWTFLLTQSAVLAVWIYANSTGIFGVKWDPYPFILMNLVLSLQAAYTAPIIMMSQNRQATIDRQEARLDYDVNKMTEGQVRTVITKLEDQERELREIRRMLSRKYGN